MIDVNTDLQLENFSLTTRAEWYLMQVFRASPSACKVGLRLVVRSEGWAGLNGQLSVEVAPPAGDRTFRLRGLLLFSPPQSLELLDGVSIDTCEMFGRVRLTFLDPQLLPHTQPEPSACSSEKTQP